MTRQVTRKLPDPPPMRLGRTRSTAITYELYVPSPLGGYALCTVNDHTGELAIHSDWGRWSYQWSPRPEHLGAQNLTAFLAKMPDVESDYVARKLQGGWNQGQRFDGLATAMEMVKEIARHRLDHGRNAIERYRDMVEWNGRPYTMDDAEHDLDCRNSETVRHLTPSAARGLADAIIDLGEECDATHGDKGNSKVCETLFCERVQGVLSNHDAEWMFNEPWEHIQHTQTFDDRILRESILPALFAACRQTRIAAMMVAANGPQDAPEYPDAASERAA